MQCWANRVSKAVRYFWSHKWFIVMVAFMSPVAHAMYSFVSYNQSYNIAYVRDDSRPETIQDVVCGNRDGNTRYFADMAALSANIYSDVSNLKNTHVGNWKRVTPDEVFLDRKKWIIFLGLKYDLWRNDHNRKMAVVFRGTVDGHSWLSNFHWFFKRLPFVQDQYEQVRVILPKLLNTCHLKLKSMIYSLLGIPWVVGSLNLRLI